MCSNSTSRYKECHIHCIYLALNTSHSEKGLPASTSVHQLYMQIFNLFSKREIIHLANPCKNKLIWSAYISFYVCICCSYSGHSQRMTELLILLEHSLMMTIPTGLMQWSSSLCHATLVIFMLLSRLDWTLDRECKLLWTW